MKRIFLYLSIIVCTITACSDDEQFTTSPTALLTFSTDSVKMDTVFSNVGSRTYDFWVYNRTNRGLRLQSVFLRMGKKVGRRIGCFCLRIGKRVFVQHPVIHVDVADLALFMEPVRLFELVDLFLRIELR